MYSSRGRARRIRGPIDLPSITCRTGVKISGQSMPAQSHGCAGHALRRRALPALIQPGQGRGKDGEVMASTESIQLGRFQPWLAQSLAPPGAAKSDVAFFRRCGRRRWRTKTVRWRQIDAAGEMQPSARSRGPVRLTLLTSQAKKFVKAGVDMLNLREEKAITDRRGQERASASIHRGRGAAFTAAQKAAAANKTRNATEK